MIRFKIDHFVIFIIFLLTISIGWAAYNVTKNIKENGKLYTCDVGELIYNSNKGYICISEAKKI